MEESPTKQVQSPAEKSLVTNSRNPAIDLKATDIVL